MIAPHHYNFNLFNSLILGGIVQGLIFGAVVAGSKKYRAPSTMLLAALIVIFSLNNLQYYVADAQIFRLRYLYGISWTPLQLLMGPLLLFYGLKLLYPEKPIARKLVIGLLLPFALGWLAITYLKATRTYLEAKADYLLLEGILEFVSNFLALYTIARLLLEISSLRNQQQTFVVTEVGPKLRWFRRTLLVFFLLCLAWLAVVVLMVLNVNIYGLWYIIWISLSAMIYWIGHIGIYKYGINQERKKIRSHTLDRSSVIVVADKPKSDHLELFEKLLVEKKYFLDPELTLDKIADELGLSKSHLSRLINNELQTSFPDYINQLRIKQAQYFLRHPDFSNYTLVAIGLEAGFASKTTFNNTFKKVTGMTPSEYRNAQNRSAESLSES